MDYSFLVGVATNYVPKPPEPLPVLEDEDIPPPKKKQPGAFNYWRKDDGGIKSPDKDELYFILVIDIFTLWNAKKKLENSLKSLIHDSTGLSAVEPSMYRERFLKFITPLVQ